MDKLPRLNQSIPIVDKQGHASNAFHRFWDRFATESERIDAEQESQITEIAAAQAAAAAAQADADAAQNDAIQALQDAADAQAQIVILNGTITTVSGGLSDHIADPDAHTSYVKKNQTPTWADATGTETRTTFAAYAGQTISNPPTQAEVQAIDDHVKILSERLAALINDLRDNEAIS